MAKKRGLEVHIGSKLEDSADSNPEWRTIFKTLGREISPDKALVWFGWCRFLKRENGLLVLAHWLGYGAAECLARFGPALARAASVKTIRIHRSGGFVPPGCKSTEAEGYEEYRVLERKEWDRARVDALLAKIVWPVTKARSGVTVEPSDY